MTHTINNPPTLLFFEDTYVSTMQAMQINLTHPKMLLFIANKNNNIYTNTTTNTKTNTNTNTTANTNTKY